MSGCTGGQRGNKKSSSSTQHAARRGSREKGEGKKEKKTRKEKGEGRREDGKRGRRKGEDGRREKGNVRTEKGKKRRSHTAAPGRLVRVGMQLVPRDDGLVRPGRPDLQQQLHSEEGAGDRGERERVRCVHALRGLDPVRRGLRVAVHAVEGIVEDGGLRASGGGHALGSFDRAQQLLDDEMGPARWPARWPAGWPARCSA